MPGTEDLGGHLWTGNGEYEDARKYPQEHLFVDEEQRMVWGTGALGRQQGTNSSAPPPPWIRPTHRARYAAMAKPCFHRVCLEFCNRLGFLLLISKLHGLLFGDPHSVSAILCCSIGIAEDKERKGKGRSS